MKIVDGFIFYNELDILEIHLEEVYDVVDHIIIVEGTETFAGNPKPSYYLTNIARFEKYKDKIIHFITDFKEEYFSYEELTSNSDKWFREDYQRECIRIAMKKLNLSDDDIFILTDVDEIPENNLLRGIKQGEINIDPIVYNLEMALYYYSTEFMVEQKWMHAKLTKISMLDKCPLLKLLRYCPIGITINNAGWHLSYFGNAEFIKNKLENFAEETTEHQTEIAHIKDCLANHVLPFNNKKLIQLSGINLNLPRHFIK